MRFYRVDTAKESGDYRAAFCPNTSCVHHDTLGYGKTAIRKWGWFVRVEHWDWTCPSCLQEEKWWMFLVA